MLKLSSAIFRQLLSWPIILCAALWLTLAYNLSFDEHLGAASLGAFLSYSVLALSALIVRFGYVLQQRRQQGWLRQDLLRRTTALAAVSESLAAVFSLFIFIVCSQIVVLWLNPPLNEQHEAHHLVMSRVASDSSWTFTWDDNIPEGSKLCLTFDFENSPDNVKTSSISNSIVEETVTPGNVFYWPLTVDDVRNKTITLESPLEHNLSLIRPLARLVITRPPISALPQLLLNQLLFFFTVIGLCLFIFRRLKVNGNLSSLGALSIASLTNLRDVQLMPNVGALVSSGLRYERTALTTNDIALFTWLGIGLALIYFSCKAPRADKK